MMPCTNQLVLLRIKRSRKALLDPTAFDPGITKERVASITSTVEIPDETGKLNR